MNNGELSDKSIKKHNPISFSEHFDEYEFFYVLQLLLLETL
jgi:hypothetical protein